MQVRKKCCQWEDKYNKKHSANIHQQMRSNKKICSTEGKCKGYSDFGNQQRQMCSKHDHNPFLETLGYNGKRKI